MMSIALRFIPILLDETDKIMKAQMARGADFESGNLMQKAKNMVPLLVPLFISAFRRANDLAMAMEARGYHGGEGRTKMKPLVYVSTGSYGVSHAAAVPDCDVYSEPGKCDRDTDDVSASLVETEREDVMKRVKLIVAYDGTNYCGWQVQPNGETIESMLNRHLTELLKEEIHVIGASRTDSGVHADGNVAVFDTNARMPADRISYAMNTRLPADIRIQDSCEVPPDFHPRFQQTVKTLRIPDLQPPLSESDRAAVFSFLLLGFRP